MPWFGKPGGAMQIKSNLNFNILDNQIEILSKYKFDLTTKEWIPQ